MTIYPILILAIVIFHCTYQTIKYLKEKNANQSFNNKGGKSTDLEILPSVLWGGKAYWLEDPGVCTARIQNSKIIYGEKEVVVDTELTEITVSDYIQVLEQLERIRR